VASGRELWMMSAAWRTAVESASEAPPNLCTCGARRCRGGMVG
jgi:hypothetical protein